jgi:hypothetical protein
MFPGWLGPTVSMTWADMGSVPPGAYPLEARPGRGATIRELTRPVNETGLSRPETQEILGFSSVFNQE